jgi:hypothetical protein
MNSDIWLGDMAQALRALGPLAPGRHRLVAELLGFGATAPSSDAPESEPGIGPEAKGGQPSDITGTEESDPSAAPPVALDDRLPLLVPLSTALAARSGVRQSPALAKVTAGQLTPRIPLRPLLAPQSADAVLRAVVSRWVRAGPVDTNALVQALARRQSVRTLPLKPVATLRFGTQILVDLGRGMEPFVNDRQAILRQLQSILGRESLTIRYFRYAPLRGVSVAAHKPEAPYASPPPGTRVLLLSDMGLGGLPGDFRRSSRGEWESFKRLIERFDCQATALVPFPPHRWPAWLVRLFPLISWDRHTTAGEAARRVRGR